ncbi:HD-GYP domain-containing protein [Undibacterium sp. Dicai25W]|uniref:HD-GYP domain-containing protein n=1 Tax=Undibacterium sp. Dicai25W TaxID=3413034 RepID=UPI003BF27DEF
MISISDLRVGMFVVELDRPWEKTSFLLQGFLLTELLDCQTLQSMVRELTIDPSRSDPTALLHLPWDSVHLPPEDDEPAIEQQTTVRVSYSAPPAKIDERYSLGAVTNGVKQIWQAFTGVEDAPSARKKSKVFQENSSNSRQNFIQPVPYYLRYASVTTAPQDVSMAERTAQLVPPSTASFSQFIEELYPRDVIYAPLDFYERIQGWVIKWKAAKPYQSTREQKQFIARKKHPEFIPSTLNLVIYKDRAPMQEEIKHASVAVSRTQEFLAKMSDDIHDGRELELDQVRPAVQLLTESVIANPSALMWLIRMQSEDVETYAHGLKVAVYMMTLGRHLGFARQQLNELGMIGLLMDVGKLSMPEEILKKPAKLDDEERLIVCQHVATSLHKLQQNGPLSHNVYLGISQHHERLDGTGYPQGLKAEEISIYGRMAAIVDSFAAMTSVRAYDSTRSAFDAMKELFKQAELELHAPLVEEFVQAIGIFPIGSMIELSTGEAAIVLEHNKLRRLEPQILVLTNADKEALVHPWVLNLMHQSPDAEPIRILRGLPDGAYGIDSRSFYVAKS